MIYFVTVIEEKDVSVSMMVGCLVVVFSFQRCRDSLGYVPNSLANRNPGNCGFEN